MHFSNRNGVRQGRLDPPNCVRTLCKHLDGVSCRAFRARQSLLVVVAGSHCMNNAVVCWQAPVAGENLVELVTLRAVYDTLTDL
jgi:hypothetical protein